MSATTFENLLDTADLGDLGDLGALLTIDNTPQPADLARVRDLCRSGFARSIRLSSGVSLREVADAVSSTPTSVHRWETAQRAPRGRAAVRYLAVLQELAARS